MLVHCLPRLESRAVHSANGTPAEMNHNSHLCFITVVLPCSCIQLHCPITVILLLFVCTLHYGYKTVPHLAKFTEDKWVAASPARFPYAGENLKANRAQSQNNIRT